MGEESAYRRRPGINREIIRFGSEPARPERRPSPARVGCAEGDDHVNSFVFGPWGRSSGPHKCDDDTTGASLTPGPCAGLPEMTTNRHIESIHPWKLDGPRNRAGFRRPPSAGSMPFRPRHSFLMMASRRPSFMGWSTGRVNDWLNEAGLGFIPKWGEAIQHPPPGEQFLFSRAVMSDDAKADPRRITEN